MCLYRRRGVCVCMCFVSLVQMSARNSSSERLICCVGLGASAASPAPHHIINTTHTHTHLDDEVGLPEVLPPLGVVVREGHHSGGGGVELVLGHALLLELALCVWIVDVCGFIFFFGGGDVRLVGGLWCDTCSNKNRQTKPAPRPFRTWRFSLMYPCPRATPAKSLSFSKTR